MAEIRRALLKISGEAFAPPGGQGLAVEPLRHVAREVAAASRAGVQIGIVIGGGNFIRGKTLEPAGIPRTVADGMGMLATVMNGLALTEVLRKEGVAASTFSALAVEGIVPAFDAGRCRAELAQSHVVVLAGGTGNPFFTTDTCAGLRALELGAGVLLKATKVDGVYSGDPVTTPGARLFARLTYEEVLAQNLAVMDATAIALCREHRLPIRVFNMSKPGNIERALRGEELGTLVASSTS